MAINDQGYKELAQMGYFGIGGKGGRAAVTLTVNGYQLFSTKFFQKVIPNSHKCIIWVYVYSRGNQINMNL